jgi:hypothetical protein
MITDLNKTLSINRYNYQNLTEQIQIIMNGLKQIYYLYTATGAKLRKTVTTMKTTAGSVTDYCGNFLL